VNFLRSVLTIDGFRGAGMLYNLPVFLRMARAAKPLTNMLATALKVHRNSANLSPNP
jgi:hypothetical protein